MADRVNKYHVYSATGWVCSTIWLAAASINGNQFAVGAALFFAVVAWRYGVKAEAPQGGQPVSSLKDTDHLTPEHNWSAMHPTYEACLRATISPVYATVPGTESHERAVFFGEIDRLRAEVAELAQQRGDLLRRVVALQSLVRQVLADAEAQEVLWEWYGEMRNAVASDSQPSEQTR